LIATIPTNTCFLDDLDMTSEWSRGLRVVEDFVREVGDEEYKTVMPWMDARAGWRVGDLEVYVLWVYGAPVVELRNDARRDDRAVTRVPLVEACVLKPEERPTPKRWRRAVRNRWRNVVVRYAHRLSRAPSQQPLVRQPVSNDRLWQGVRAISA
jgi:hypothetical protein